MLHKAAALLLISVAGLLAASQGQTKYETVAWKLGIIQNGRLRRGSVMHFSTEELNVYAQRQIPKYAPDGVRQAKLGTGKDTATGSALVDFLKLRHSAGIETKWMLAKLISGERPVRVTVHFRSADGTATVFLDRVEVSGVAVSGQPLDILVQTFFRPLFPEAKINEPFPLRRGLDHISVGPDGLTVYATK